MYIADIVLDALFFILHVETVAQLIISVKNLIFLLLFTLRKSNKIDRHVDRLLFVEFVQRGDVVS